MENSHAPVGSPHHKAAHFFIGYLKSAINAQGVISLKDWNDGCAAAASFMKDYYPEDVPELTEFELIEIRQDKND